MTSLREDTMRQYLMAIVLGDPRLTARYPDLRTDLESIYAVFGPPHTRDAAPEAEDETPQAQPVDPLKQQKIADMQRAVQDALRFLQVTLEGWDPVNEVAIGNDIDSMQNMFFMNLDRVLPTDLHDYYQQLFSEFAYSEDILEDLINSVDIDMMLARQVAERSLVQPEFTEGKPLPDDWIQTDMDGIAVTKAPIDPKIPGAEENNTTKTSMAALHMMLTRGRSLADCYSESPEMVEERLEAGLDFSDFQADATAENEARRCGRWCRMAGDALMGEKLPDIDYTNPGQVAEALSSLKRFTQVSQDYLAGVKKWETDNEFQDEFFEGIKGNWQSGFKGPYENTLAALARFNEIAEILHTDTASFADRTAAKMIVEQYGKQLRGKTVAETVGLLQAAKLEHQFQEYRKAAPGLIRETLKMDQNVRDDEIEKYCGRRNQINMRRWLNGENSLFPEMTGRKLAIAAHVPLNDAQIFVADMPEFDLLPIEDTDDRLYMRPEQARQAEEENNIREERRAAVIRPKFPADQAERLFRPKEWFSEKPGESLLSNCESVFNAMFGQKSTESSPATGLMAELEAMLASLPIPKQEFSSPIQLFYINGQNVDEYLKDNKLKLTDQNRMTAVIRACSQARDRVEIGVIGTATANGMEYLQQKVMEVQPDLSAFDRLAGLFDTKRSSRSSDLHKKDPEKEERQDRIRRELGERIAKAAARPPRESLAEHFSFGSSDFKKSFFGMGNGMLGGLPALPLSESQIPVEQRALYRKLIEIENIPVSCIDTNGNRQEQKQRDASELTRSGGSGMAMLAGLLTMADNPDIHYADLFDPNKYVREKRAAGQKLIDALSKMDREPGALADVIAGCAKHFSRLDLKEEIALITGEPLDSMSYENIAHDPEMMRRGIEAGNEVRKFSRGVSQVLTRIVGSGGNVQFGRNEVIAGKTAAEIDQARRDGQMEADMTTQEQVYRRVSAQMTDDERAQFQKNKDAYGNGVFRSVDGILAYLEEGEALATERRSDADLLSEYATAYLDMRYMLGRDDHLGPFGSEERILAVVDVKRSVTEYYNDHPDEAREALQAIRTDPSALEVQINHVVRIHEETVMAARRQEREAAQNGTAPNAPAANGRQNSRRSFFAMRREQQAAQQEAARRGQPTAPQTNGQPTAPQSGSQPPAPQRSGQPTATQQGGQPPAPSDPTASSKPKVKKPIDELMSEEQQTMQQNQQKPPRKEPQKKTDQMQTEDTKSNQGMVTKH